MLSWLPLSPGGTTWSCPACWPRPEFFIGRFVAELLAGRRVTPHRFEEPAPTSGLLARSSEVMAEAWVSPAALVSCQPIRRPVALGRSARKNRRDRPYADRRGFARRNRYPTAYNLGPGFPGRSWPISEARSGSPAMIPALQRPEYVALAARFTAQQLRRRTPQVLDEGPLAVHAAPERSTWPEPESTQASKGYIESDRSGVTGRELWLGNDTLRLEAIPSLPPPATAVVRFLSPRRPRRAQKGAERVRADEPQLWALAAAVLRAGAANMEQSRQRSGQALHAGSAHASTFPLCFSSGRVLPEHIVALLLRDTERDGGCVVEPRRGLARHGWRIARLTSGVGAVAHFGHDSRRIGRRPAGKDRRSTAGGVPDPAC